jgi:hypothetical protein
MFLSQKPILYALNIGESTTLGDDLEAAVSRFKLDEVAHRPNAGATAICGKVEAELAEMDDEEAAEFLGSYGLHESGLVRLIRKSYELLGLISFFTAGEDECRAWTIPVGSKAPQGAGAIHSDLEHHFIRAETIRWDNAAGGRLRGRGARQRHAAPGRQGIRGAGWRRDAHPAQRVRPNAQAFPHSRRDCRAGRRGRRAGAGARQGRGALPALFVALGAGFLMATALLEMMPEGLRLSPRLGPVLIMAGYCVVHLLEHTINAHFHYGEETHHGEFVSPAYRQLGAGRPERSCAL